MSHNFGMVGDQIRVKKKDPPVFPTILVWSVTKFGWKKNTLCMSHNFGMVGDQIRVKKKDPPIFPTILVWSVTKFGWKKKNTLCRNSKPRLAAGQPRITVNISESGPPKVASRHLRHLHKNKSTSSEGNLSEHCHEVGLSPLLEILAVNTYCTSLLWIQKTNYFLFLTLAVW